MIVWIGGRSKEMQTTIVCINRRTGSFPGERNKFRIKYMNLVSIRANVFFHGVLVCFFLSHGLRRFTRINKNYDPSL